MTLTKQNSVTHISNGIDLVMRTIDRNVLVFVIHVDAVTNVDAC